MLLILTKCWCWCWLCCCRGLKGPLSPGREKRGGTDSDRDSELELDYAQCEFNRAVNHISRTFSQYSGKASTRAREISLTDFVPLLKRKYGRRREETPSLLMFCSFVWKWHLSKSFEQWQSHIWSLEWCNHQIFTLVTASQPRPDFLSTNPIPFNITQ